MAKAVVRVRTPENVELEYELAGIGSRAIAQIIDMLVIGLVATLVSVSVAFWVAAHPANISASYVVGATVLFVFFFFWGYFILFEYFASGKTPGKRLLKIRVVQNSGSRASLVSVLLRNLFRIVDVLPGGYLVGFVVMLINGKERRVGDIVAGTMVVAAPLQQFVWLSEDAEDSLQPLNQPSEPARVREITVPGQHSRVVAQYPLPPSWDTFVNNLLRRLPQMSKAQERLLIEETWEKLICEGIVSLLPESTGVDEGAAAVTAQQSGAAALNHRDIELILQSLVQKGVGKQRGNRS